jgi:hypothetical protein
MQRFEALEGQRREERQKAIEEKLSTGFDLCNALRLLAYYVCVGVVPEGLEEDDEKDNIGDATIGQHFDAKNRQSVRNLRIREDTAKFLFNLDPNSAHYDPRTRAMRANPLQGEVRLITARSSCSMHSSTHKLDRRTRSKLNSPVTTSFATLVTSNSSPRASSTKSLLKK